MALVPPLESLPHTSSPMSNATKHKALNIIEGKIIAGSVAQLIERFRDEIAPTYCLDQFKDDLAVWESGYKNLSKFFGKWIQNRCACCTAISTWTLARKQARRRRRTKSCR